MQTVARTTYVTEAEFMSIPESMDHVELMEGEVVMAPASGKRHQKVVGLVFRSLDAWAMKHPPAWAAVSPLDVRLAKDTVVQPDVSLFLREPANESPIRQVPDIVVEVLSYNRSYDRMTKRLAYAQAGVREYWMVDPENRVVELSTSLTSMVVVQDRIESQVAEGWTLPVPDLWVP